jgi:hypothetical protein
VTSVEPGTEMTVVDLLSGATRVVREASASRLLVARDALLGRVVEYADFAVLCGVHPFPLPPLEVAEVVRRVRTKLRCKADVPCERLREEDVCRLSPG